MGETDTTQETERENRLWRSRCLSKVVKVPVIREEPLLAAFAQDVALPRAVRGTADRIIVRRIHHRQIGRVRRR
jgi:hypothetical protein